MEIAASIGRATKTVERIIKSYERIKRSGHDMEGHWTKESE